MKVGVFASNEYPYPLPQGTIQAALAMAGLITKGLTSLGEEVIFFCSEDSNVGEMKNSLGYYSMHYDKVPEKIPGMLPRNHVKTMYIQNMFSDVIKYLNDNPVDVLQLHNIRETLPFLKFLPKTPIILTMNDNPFEPHHKHYLMEYRDKYPHVSFVSISKNQRKALPNDFTYAGNVYNGIEIDKFKFNPDGGEGIINVGRFLKKNL